MPSPKRRHGFQPAIVEAVGPLPLGGESQVVLKAILERRRAYRQVGPGNPPVDLTFLMLAHAGLLAEGLGGYALSKAKNGAKPRRYPILREPLELLGRFVVWLQGGGEFGEGDLRAAEGLVGAGLEAYGFALPSERARGRPALNIGGETVRHFVVRKHRQILAGQVTVASIVRDCAKQAILERKRAHAETRGKNPNGITLTRDDATDVEHERRRLKIAYERLEPLTDAQILARRNYLAWAYRTARKGIKTRDAFCDVNPATSCD